jgi:hypothetical protein
MTQFFGEFENLYGPGSGVSRKSGRGQAARRRTDYASPRTDYVSPPMQYQEQATGPSVSASVAKAFEQPLTPQQGPWGWEGMQHRPLMREPFGIGGVGLEGRQPLPSPTPTTGQTFFPSVTPTPTGVSVSPLAQTFGTTPMILGGTGGALPGTGVGTPTLGTTGVLPSEDIGADFVPPIQRKGQRAMDKVTVAGLTVRGAKVPDITPGPGDMTSEQFSKGWRSMENGIFPAHLIRTVKFREQVLSADGESLEWVERDVLSVMSEALFREWANIQAAEANVTGDQVALGELAEKIRQNLRSDALADAKHDEDVRVAQEDEKNQRDALEATMEDTKSQTDIDLKKALGDIEYLEGQISNEKLRLENLNDQKTAALAESGRVFDLQHDLNLQIQADAALQAEYDYEVALQIATDAAALEERKLDAEIAAKLAQGLDAEEERKLKASIATERVALEKLLGLAETDRIKAEAVAADLQITAQRSFEATQAEAQRDFEATQAGYARTEAAEERELRKVLGLADIARIQAEEQRENERLRYEAALQNPYAYSAAQSLGGLGLGPQDTEGLAQTSQFLDPLAQLGFGIPAGTQAGQQIGAGQFFGGGIPTLGNLSQIDPEALQFLLATLGFTGTSIPQFGQQAGAITPGVQGVPSGQLIGGVRAGGR